MGGQPGKPTPPGNPPRPRERQRPPVEEPRPIPVPPVERSPDPMQVDRGPAPPASNTPNKWPRPKSARTGSALARLIGARIDRFAGLSLSVQTLAHNLIKIALVFLALLIGLNTVGIDLTAFAVFSGAIGVGLGFRLQTRRSRSASLTTVTEERGML